MAYCSQCGNEIADDAKFCTNCGATMADAASNTESAAGNNASNVQANYTEPYDHSSEFDPKDISENKVYALCAYSLAFMGIIIGILVGNNSEYVKFHTREAVKIQLSKIVCCVLTSLLCWTCIGLIAGVIILCMLYVVQIIAFVQVCQGQAKEPWLIRSIKALH